MLVCWIVVLCVVLKEVDECIVFGFDVCGEICIECVGWCVIV